MSRAEYMRNYRAAKKHADGEMDRLLFKSVEIDPTWAKQRIETLEAEIKHLKTQLAMREPYKPIEGIMRSGPTPIGGAFNSRPFTPAPKKGK